MYYVYVIQSQFDNNYYTGYTDNLDRRINEHNSKKVLSTKNRVPFKLVYFEGSLNKYDALHREKYLKTAYGKKYLKNRLRNYLIENESISRGKRVTEEEGSPRVIE